MGVGNYPILERGRKPGFLKCPSFIRNSRKPPIPREGPKTMKRGIVGGVYGQQEPTHTSRGAGNLLPLVRQSLIFSQQDPTHTSRGAGNLKVLRYSFQSSLQETTHTSRGAGNVCHISSPSLPDLSQEITQASRGDGNMISFGSISIFFICRKLPNPREGPETVCGNTFLGSCGCRKLPKPRKGPETYQRA